MRVDIEEILKINKMVSEINEKQFDEIEWFENGQRIIISKEVIDNWKFIGLNNTSFIYTKFPS